MKCRMKRVASLFLALALCAGMTMNVGAVTVQEAENKADELEGKKNRLRQRRKISRKIKRDRCRYGRNAEETDRKRRGDRTG